MISKGQKPGTVRFSLAPTDNVKAKKVRLFGDFTDWKPIPMKKQKDGCYAVTVPLEKGQYQYKFKIDDQWLLDPDNHDCQTNNFGTLNSIISAD